MTDDIKPRPHAEPVHVPTDQPPPTRTPAASATPAAAAAKPTVVKTQPGKVEKPPRQSSNGVGLAIFATVVIILGLAGLAVLAYIKTQK
jgi:hypothetical protein